jgi:hypothetical protein
MSATKYTPGPWSFEDESPHINKVRSQGDIIAQVIGDSPEADANARLIAAAPDMLEALEAVYRWQIEAIGDEDRVLDLVADAINKARGQA